MGFVTVLRQALAPRTAARISHHTSLAVWWGAGELAAVTVAADGRIAPVFFAGWPVQATTGMLDAEVFTRLATAIGVPAGDVRLTAVLPSTWGPAARAGWHRAAATAGYVDVSLAAAPSIVATVAGAAPGSGGVWVTAAVGAGSCQVSAWENTVVPGEVLAEHSRVLDADLPADGLPAVIADVLAAADRAGPPERIVLAGNPETTGRLTEPLGAATGVPVSAVTAPELARAVAEAAEPSPSPVPGPPRAGITGAVMCAVLGMLLAVSVITDASVVFASPRGTAAVFSPGHLAVAGFAVAFGAVAGGMLIVHARLAAARAWDWARAGTWLVAGAACGLAACGTVGLSLAAVHAVPAGRPLIWAVLPSLVGLAGYAGTGAGLRTWPEPAPVRRIWPPIGAVALATGGVLVQRSAEPIWEQMSTGAAYTVRAGLVMIAVATGWALASKTPIIIGVSAVLAVAYVFTTSAAAGTAACLLFITAATARIATGLGGLARDWHRAGRFRSLIAGGVTAGDREL